MATRIQSAFKTTKKTSVDMPPYVQEYTDIRYNSGKPYLALLKCKTIQAAVEQLKPSLKLLLPAPNAAPVTGLFESLGTICLVNGVVHTGTPNSCTVEVAMALCLLLRNGPVNLVPPTKWKKADIILVYNSVHAGCDEPTLDNVLARLLPNKDGNELVRTKDELDGKQVLSFRWARESISSKMLLPSAEYDLLSPPVKVEKKKVVKTTAATAAAENENGGAGKRQNKRKLYQNGSLVIGDEEEMVLELTGDGRPVSPFTEADIPMEDREARSLLIEDLRNGTSSLSPSAAASTSSAKGTGKHAESTMELDEPSLDDVKWAGFEELPMDEALKELKEEIWKLDLSGEEMKDMILSKEGDDNLTDEEREGGGPAFKGKQKQKMPKRGYACETSGKELVKGPNWYIAEKLEELAAEAKRNDPMNPFRAIGYQKAAGQVRQWPKPIATYAEAVNIPSIGDSIATKIVEIIKTGGHRRLHMSEEDECISVLQRIYGVGIKYAEEFYEMGIRSPEDVVNRKFGLNPTDAQMLGAIHYKDLQERIPRAEVEKIGELIKGAASLYSDKLQVEVMGSFRRGALDCGDVDILVTCENPVVLHGAVTSIMKILTKTGSIVGALSEPEDADAQDACWKGLIRLPGEGHKVRRLDVLGVPFDEMPAALIYFTGNDFFNRSLRLKARHMGYSLNQRDLSKDVIRARAGGLKETQGVRIKVKSEREIFEILGVKWREPTERIPC